MRLLPVSRKSAEKKFKSCKLTNVIANAVKQSRKDEQNDWIAAFALLPRNDGKSVCYVKIMHNVRIAAPTSWFAMTEPVDW